MRPLCLAALLVVGCSSAGPTGPQGPQGEPGPTGPMGAMGAMGAPGTMGTMGNMGVMGNAGASVAIASLPVGDPNCANGGTSFTVGTTVTYACNGINGASAAVTSLPVGDANCPNGGTQITANGVSTYACNGNFTGTFTGTATFSGTSSFTGPATFTGTTQLPATATFGGFDLFNAAWQGVYPAVLGDIFADGFWCGPAPSTFDVSSDVGGSAAYGKLMTTFEGQIVIGMGGPFPTTCPTSGTQAYCWGPFTFFLNNPGAAKNITIPVYLDDGPSFIYVDGNLGTNKFISGSIAGTQNVTVPIPSGGFALSFIACSNNGPSIGFQITSKFLTANGLQLDYARTLHKGK